jgi:guanosine-3',5'-bis(diphosphate) 3'-pyrophosphohydrolase
MKYNLKVYDNYHYGDESEAYNHGWYDTYEEAETTAKAIVNEFLEHNWSRGETANILIAEYCLYGEDPVIIPTENQPSRKFSGRDYANEIAETICMKLENEQRGTEVQTLYQDAIKFATYKHLEKRQKVKGTKLPYVVHLSNVAMEIFMAAPHTKDFNLIYAIQAALLHDTIEDTATTFDEIKESFGEDIAIAVLALSKDNNLPKNKQILDSLARIKKLQKEVWAVKLADRITNLQPPPASWSRARNIKYLKESQVILDELRDGNQYLANRLEAKISENRNQLKRFLLDKV